MILSHCFVRVEEESFDDFVIIYKDLTKYLLGVANVSLLVFKERQCGLFEPGKIAIEAI